MPGKNGTGPGGQGSGRGQGQKQGGEQRSQIRRNSSQKLRMLRMRRSRRSSHTLRILTVRILRGFATSTVKVKEELSTVSPFRGIRPRQCMMNPPMDS